MFDLIETVGLNVIVKIVSFVWMDLTYELGIIPFCCEVNRAELVYLLAKKYLESQRIKVKELN